MHCSANSTASDREQSYFSGGLLGGSVEHVNQFFDQTGLTYKIVNKASSLIKATKGVVEVFSAVSENFSKYFVVLEPIKIFQIPLYSRKAIQAGVKLLKVKTYRDIFQNCFKIYKSLKKITSGVAAALKCSVLLGLLRSSALCWTDIAGYVFLPVTLISAALNFENTARRCHLLFVLCKTGSNEAEAAKCIQNNYTKLRKFKIVAKGFDARFDTLAKQINCKSPRKRSAARKEINGTVRRMKVQMGAFICVQATKTTLKITSATMAVLALITPIAIVPAVCIDLALAVGSVSMFAASKALSHNCIR